MLSFSILHGKTKKVLFFLISFITLALVASFVTIPAGAEEPQGEEKPQLAPVSVEFEAFRQKPPGEFYGYIPPPIDLSHLKDLPVERPAPRKALALDASFDWRNSDKVTPVKDQGDAGTCWVFGTLAAVESKVLIGESVEYDFSEQNLVCCTDPSWVYLHDNRRDAGGWSWLATDTLTKKGSRLESCNPYDVETINTDACNDSCTTIERITGYRLVAATTDLVKDAVYYQGPVSMAFHWDGGYFDSGTNIYSYPDCPEPPNHLVSIVGWDDSKGTSGAWIVKNSWGTGWGEIGYFYLCYDSGNMGEVAFYGYKDYDFVEKVYYWDEAGWVGSLGYGSNYAWMASVFTAEQSGTLTNVDFWATSNNAQYEIYVYDDGDPSDGLENQLTSQSGDCLETGYYSIALVPPVSLSASQQFTIAVKMTTPDYDYPIPAEWIVSDMCEPPIQTGVSYSRHEDGGNWADLAPNYNACLRAEIYETYFSNILIKAQDYSTDVSSITFPTGIPNATVSAPYNNHDGIGSPQVFGGAGTAKPVVTLLNSAAVDYIIWYNISIFTEGVVASESYLINDRAAACLDADAINNPVTFGSLQATTTTIVAGAGNEVDLYLKVVLSSLAGKSGTSTLTILGEIP